MFLVQSLRNFGDWCYEKLKVGWNALNSYTDEFLDCWIGEDKFFSPDSFSGRFLRFSTYCLVYAGIAGCAFSLATGKWMLANLLDDALCVVSSPLEGFLFGLKALVLLPVYFYLLMTATPSLSWESETDENTSTNEEGARVTTIKERYIFTFRI